ncbi:alpha/beta hydrolase [Actinophytocola sp.]|uniref:alpha/beta hydrolase n=1 Tax=Actinophytocola sp. TaxID=1872138 RepID=UPI002ED645C8
MAYAFDPELAPWIAMLPNLEFTDIAELRGADEMMSEHMPRYDPPVPVSIRDVVVPGSPDVPVRVYAPEEQDGPLPGMVFIHGGGFILGSAAMFDSDATRIAAEVGAVVVSVDYRLAPENPFPAGLDDCYAALVWTAKSATELGIDPDRLAVGGDSAGGGLAAAVALLARDRGGPELCFQYLGIPELDDRLNTPSMQAYHDTPLWHRPAAEFSWDCYLGGPGIRGTEDVSPYAAPARAEDLSGLPPAFVNVCQFDPLRDEGIAYAQRLAQANVPTELVLYPGTFHGAGMIAAAQITKRITTDQLAALRRAFAA